jgi:hypothetical protein
MFKWLFKKSKYYADEWDVTDINSWIWRRGDTVMGNSVTILLKSSSSDKTALIKAPRSGRHGEWLEIKHELMKIGVHLIVGGENVPHKVTLAE